MGCVISSGITLVVSRRYDSSYHFRFLMMITQIFFPRSVAGEIAAKDASKDNKYSLQQLNTFRTTQLSEGFEVISGPGAKMTSLSDYRGTHDAPSSMHHRDLESPSPTKGSPSDLEAQALSPSREVKKKEARKEKDETKPKTVVTFSPNRRAEGGSTIEGGVTVLKLTERNLAEHDVRSGSIHPLVHNFTSPIGASCYFPPGS